MSLSARRAWIEMPWGGWGARPPRVALRKESVDRNLVAPLLATGGSRSLSARRAWIEIGVADYVQYDYKSLSARRAWIEIFGRLLLV